MRDAEAARRTARQGGSVDDQNQSRASISFEKNGPIHVQNLERLLDADGNPIPAAGRLKLCRCGGSSTKPFCDSTHKRIGWTDEPSPDRVPDRLDRYEADGVTILDNRGVCAHVGSCVARLPEVFGHDRPWIKPQGATSERIMDTIRRCPSGALAYELAGRAHTAFNDVEEIVVSKDGPYLVRGGVRLEGAALGEGQGSEHYTLCRCGASKNKPFCDGTHSSIGFRDDQSEAAAPAPAGEPEGSHR